MIRMTPNCPGNGYQMSEYKRKLDPAKRLPFWPSIEFFFFIFSPPPTLDQIKHSQTRWMEWKKTAWLWWKKSQTELRWPLATFPVRVTSASVCWDAFCVGGERINKKINLSRAVFPLPLWLFLSSQKDFYFVLSPSFRGDESCILGIFFPPLCYGLSLSKTSLLIHRTPSLLYLLLHLFWQNRFTSVKILSSVNQSEYSQMSARIQLLYNLCL